MKKLFVVSLAILAVLAALFVSCDDKIQVEPTNYKTPTATGRVDLPVGAGIPYNSIYIKVAETGAVHKVKSDGSYAIPNLEEGKKYTLLFQSKPFDDPKSKGFDFEVDELDDIEELKALVRMLFACRRDNAEAATGEGHDNGVSVMKRTAAIAGFAKLDGQDNSLGVDVFIPGTSYGAKTRRDGRFTITGIMEGTGYTLAYMYPGYSTKESEPFNIAIEEGKGNILKFEDVVLTKATGSVSGTIKIHGDVIDEALYDDVRVSLINEEDSSKNCVIASVGDSFSKEGVEPGTYKIEAVLTGYQKVTKGGVAIEASKNVDVGELPELVANGGKITGSVRLQSADAHSGIVVLAEHESGRIRYTASTSSDGSFEIAGCQPGSYTVAFSKSGYVSWSAAAAVGAGSDAVPLEHELTRDTGSVRGTVVLDTGLSPKDISVTLRSQKSGAARTTLTDAEGNFAFEGCEPGGYTLVISKEFYDGIEDGGVHVGAGEETPLAKTLCKNTGTVSGSLVFADGTVPAGTSVVLTNAAGNNFQCYVEDDGSFTLEDAAEGSYTVEVRAPGHMDETGSVNVARNRVSEITINMRPATGAISGRIKIHGDVIDEALYDEVTVSLINEEDSSRSYVVAKTGDSFSKEGVEPGTYRVEAVLTGYQKVTKDGVAVEAGKSVDVGELPELVANGGKITGSVRLQSADAHSGIVVLAEHESGRIRYTASTSSDGSFEIAGCQPGSYAVSFSKSGYVSWSATAVVGASSDAAPLDHELTKDTGSVRGTVVLDTGLSPKDISVTLRSQKSGAAKTTLTDADGNFAFEGCAPGDYTLVISKEFYDGIEDGDIHINAGEETPLASKTLRKNTGTIAGKVASDSAPIEGAIVSISYPDGSETRTVATGADGTYVIDNVQTGICDVSITANGYLSYHERLLVVAGEAHTINPKLDRSYGVISGTAKLAGASDYSGITVSAMLIGGSDGTKLTKTTAADGAYNITGITKEGSYQIMVSKEGYASDNSAMVEVTFGSVAVPKTVELKNISVTLSGRIVLDGAAEHSGVAVLVEETSGGRSYNTSTNQEGLFSIGGVAPGEYTLLASKDGYVSKKIERFAVSPSTDKKLEDMSLVIGSRSVVGKVTAELAADNAGILVTATNLEKPDLIYSAITNAEGDFSLVGLKPGRYRVTYSKDNYGSQTTSEVDIVADETAKLPDSELAINRGGIFGYATLEGRTDHSGTKVTLIGTEETELTDANGYYLFNVPSRNYPGGLRFEKEDFALGSLADTLTVLTNSSFQAQPLEMKATHVTIQGRVDVLGTENEGGVSVSLDGTDLRLTTKSDGGFRFDHVPLERGRYTLRLVLENAPEVTRTVEVHPASAIDTGTVTVIPNSATLTGVANLDGMTDHYGITVSAVSADGTSQASTVTDAGGFFRIPNILSTGEYTISFSKEGWDSQTIEGVGGLEPLEERSVTGDDPVVLKDSTAPVLDRIMINSGANTAGDRDVTIMVTASDKGSGIAQMQYCFDNVFDRTVTMRTYQGHFGIELPGGNGEKTVYLRVFDKSGNVSEAKSATVTLVDQKTEVGGVLGGDKLRWTKDMSPYLVTANILVEEGKELVIDPGVDVQFAGAFYIQVDGALAAEGTEAERIKFYGIGDGAGEIKTANKGSATISYCDVSAAATGIDIIENSTIEGNVKSKRIYRPKNDKKNYGGTISDSTVVGNSDFNNCRVDNVDFNGKVDSKDSEFSYCSFKGSVTSSNDNFEYSEFKNCAFDRWGGSSICWSNIVDCGTMSVFSNRSQREKLYCSGNFWGYDKTREMEESTDGNYGFIYDYHDDFNLSQICAHNFQEEPLAGIGYMGAGFVHVRVPDHYKIGDIGPAGGMVFYVDVGEKYPEWDYLETSTGEDGIGNYKFGYYYVDGSTKEVGTETGVGAGKRNTEKLLAAMGDAAWDFRGNRTVSEYAAKMADGYEQNGYDDWFLPSMDELDLVYQNLQKPRLSEFSGSWCLSSSELGNTLTYKQTFGKGDQSYDNRDTNLCVRPVRAFSDEDPEPCQVNFISDGEPDIEPMKIRMGGSFPIPDRSREYYKLESITDQYDRSYSEGQRIVVDEDLTLTYNWVPAEFTYKIGDEGPAGGIVFYVDIEDKLPEYDYMETITDKDGLGSYQFGYCYVDGLRAAVGTETGVGTGKRNTEKLVAAMEDAAWDGSGNRNVPEYAAKKCSEYSVAKDGVVYDDWFLPSKDELDLVYQNLHKPGLSGFSGSWCWSSSENNNDYVWKQYFGGGDQNYYSRTNEYYVRPVRAF